MPRIVVLCLASLLLLCDTSFSQDLSSDFGDLKFRYVGPSRGGRVTTVTGHRAQPRTFYMGATGGGVWKTTDSGSNWNNLSDGYFETGSIGSIDVADSDPNIIYVGTGSDGIRSNVIIGRGLYKSTDAGKTWEMKGLRDMGQLGSVVVHPTNPEVVFVAALGSPFGDNPERGVYKTTDGGATWKQMLFVSAKTGAVDIELSPDNSDIVYAAMWRAERKPWTIISGDTGKEDGIYVSRDGGETWSKKSEGLPNDLIGKVDFAVSVADPSRVYALVETDPKREGLYRSNDHGESWQLVNNFRSLMDRPFYYTNIDADPSNADMLYVNSTGFFASVDAGKNWTRRSTMHGDNHDIWINPDDSRIWVQSNDGGASVTLDAGETWSTQNNQPTAELYQVNVDDRYPYWLYAGQQDNSTIAVPSNSTGNKINGAAANWEATGGCETGPAVPKPGDADVVYANCKGMFDVFNRRTGRSQQYYVGAANMYGRNPADLTYRFQRTVPIEVSPHNPNVVYHGSQFVHKTSNNGELWETISPDLTAFRKERQVESGGPITRDITGEEHYSVLYVIEESPVQQGVIWTGANDGPVSVTRDGGATWTNVTPKGMPPEGRIQSIDPSPFDAGTAYAAGYRYLLNDFEPYIFKTSDFGASWTRLTDGKNGIAIDTPVRVVREDPDRKGLLYAGTEYGFYVSFNDGGLWQRFDSGLPATPITDIKVVQGDVVLSTMGRGFWIMDDVSPLRQFAEIDSNQFFDPRDTFRTSRFSHGGSASDPDYAPSGVKLNYFLASSSKADVMVSIFNNGQLVRQYINEPARQGDQQDQGMRGPQVRPERSAGLSSDKGLHRFIWDMRVDGPRNDKGEVTRGPIALPGTYTAKISVGDWSGEQSVELVMDPLMAAEGLTFDDLEAQFTFAIEMAELSMGANTLAEKVKELIKTAPKDAKIADEGLKDSRKRMPDVSSDPIAELNYILSQLETDNSDSYPPPMLLSQIGYLTGMATRSDQRPGKDAYVRYEELRRQYLELSERAAIAEEAVAAAKVQKQ